MKRSIFFSALILISFVSKGQMESAWFQGHEKYVCAAYNYGQFSGETGKRLKYRPYGRQTIKGRSHRAHQYNARRRAQKRLHLFAPHR